MKKRVILFLSAVILPLQAFAMVSFDVTGASYFSSLKVEDNLLLLESSNKDFVFLYNNKNEMVYIKHKNLDATFKVSFLQLRNAKFLTKIRPEETELVLENFKSNLYTVDFASRDCLQFYTAKDLQVGSSISSIFAIYKAFVYLTGQGQINNACKNFNISKNLDAELGMPMAIFYKDMQFKLTNMSNDNPKMKDYLKIINLDTKKAIKISLQLQYELMSSLLADEQRDALKEQIKDKSINIKIKSMQNLLNGF